jgi:peptide/nickel transport system substrate-binding protein
MPTNTEPMLGNTDSSWLEDDGLLTRRKALQVGGTGLVAVTGASSLLAACGGTSSGTASTAAASGGAPVHGGTMNFGGQGGANTDTLEAQNGLTNTDFARLSQLYDPLVRMGDTGQPQFALAESLTPNKTATEWTIRIRKGVVMHDGKEFRAPDVLFSFNRIMKNKFPGSTALGPIDLPASKVVDPYTVLLRFKKPFSILMEALALHWYFYMVPVGYDPKRPVGTGPFKLVNFTPGQASTMIRHIHYWDAPKPYLDKVITTNINDETAQINALESGAVDAIDYLTAGSVGTLSSSSAAKLVISNKTGGWEPFVMEIDKTPFSDVRVRTAMKLAIDRPGMLKAVFAGYGQVGNDVFGRYDKNYDPSLLPQRHQDLEQAKSLLKSAGYPDLSVQLVTTPNAPGMVQAAQIFATQAAGAGIRTKVVNYPVTTFFASYYLKVPFSQDYWQYAPYLVDVSQDSITGAPFDWTHFYEYDNLYNQATSTLDTTRQREIVQEMMKMDYEKGGNIIPFFFPVIDAVAPHVYGVVPTVSGQAMRTFQFHEFWMKK